MLCYYDNIKLMKQYILLFTLLAVSTSGFAQRQVRQATREGNSLFHKEDYLNAEIQYRKALEAGPTDSLAIYNLGNALIHQQQDEKAKESLQQFVNAASAAQKGGNRQLAAKSFFNAGDVCMAAQQYKEAVNFFKRSLRNNPADDEARYNLFLAQKLLQQQEDENQDQDQKQDQQQQQQQNQDQNQDQQKQDQQDQQQQDQQDQQQDQQNQPQEQQQQQSQMSKDQAEAILNANNRDEKQTQEKVQQQQMQQMQRRKTSKDW